MAGTTAPIIQPPLCWDKSNRTQRNASLTQNWTHNTDAQAVCRGWGHAQRPRWCSYRSNCTKFKIRPGPVLRSNKNRRKIQIAKIAALKSTARRVREMGCKAKFSPSSRNIWTLFSLFVCCGILASFKSKISRFAWLFWPDRWHPKFPLICGKIFTQPEIWSEFSFDNLNL